jgi:NADH-quinone oxidoreductase subunit N
LFGSFGAYSQKNLKRFFAYTSLNQLGFILLGLGSFSLDLAISASLLFLITYVLNNILFFSILLCFYSSSSYKPLVLLADLKGLSYFYPWHVLGLSVALFSFIGLPPLAGFFSKFLILLAACKSNFFFYIMLGLLSNGISAFYYIKLLKLVWFDSFMELRLKSFFFKSFTNYRVFLLVILCSLFNCFFFLFIDLFFNFLSIVSKSCFFPYF